MPPEDDPRNDDEEAYYEQFKKDTDETIEELAERRLRELQIECSLSTPKEPCEHVWHHDDWPCGGWGPTHCEKCGMSFTYYSFCECP